MRVEHFRRFSYTASTSEALSRSISEPRMNTYLHEVEGNLNRALRLYAWNAEVSGAFFPLLHTLEVTVRNAMHEAMMKAYGDGKVWWTNPRLEIIKSSRKAIKKTMYHLEKDRGEGNYGPNDIVSGLPFSFWENLLARRLKDTVWVPALSGAFPNMPRITDQRRLLHSHLRELRWLRNRVAHHEALISRDLMADYNRITSVLGWACHETQNWVEMHSRVPEVILARPE